MDVRPANVDIVKRASVTVSAVRHCARNAKREEEPDSRQEKAALRPITDMQVKEFTDFRIMKEQKDDSDSHKNSQTEQPGLGQHDGVFPPVPNGTLNMRQTREVYVSMKGSAIEYLELLE